ncbi:hypothetical protein OSB04_024719 [Centaurea solstitialis]|uniref:EGF-like domain-containing protein n=1 Tax=Centaurea solstitialis TaxID=347529 RepID=A0AA38W3C9_9ASTR|nr:hypothetical protein OSB04_024719 [Centaurea solstitialis]
MLLLYTLILVTLPSTTVSSLPSPNDTLQTAMAIAGGSIGKQGCQTQCGNVIVPYPFGIGLGKGCSLDVSFDLNCRSNEKLFHRSSNIKIYNISNFEARVANSIGYICYNEQGNVTQENEAMTILQTTEPFTFSQKNKFTVIGCDDYGSINGTNFSGLCWGTCSNELEVSYGHCSGIGGCAQISITKGLKRYNVNLSSGRNHSGIYYFNPCGMMFLGEEGSFKFLGVTDLINYTEFLNRTLSSVPIVLDWVIGGNRTCREATECKGNSFCKDAEIGGYHCICKEGYEGNPYLDPGCQEINECKDNSPCNDKEPKFPVVILLLGEFKYEPLFGCECEDSRKRDMWQRLVNKGGFECGPPLIECPPQIAPSHLPWT